MLFMGLCALIGAGLAVFLPETLGSSLPETLDDVDALGKDSKPFFAWWSTKQLKEHQRRVQEEKEEKERRQSVVESLKDDQESVHDKY